MEHNAVMVCILATTVIQGSWPAGKSSLVCWSDHISEGESSSKFHSSLGGLRKFVGTVIVRGPIDYFKLSRSWHICIYSLNSRVLSISTYNVHNPGKDSLPLRLRGKWFCKCGLESRLSSRIVSPTCDHVHHSPLQPPNHHTLPLPDTGRPHCQRSAPIQLWLLFYIRALRTALRVLTHSVCHHNVRKYPVSNNYQLVLDRILQCREIRAYGFDARIRGLWRVVTQYGNREMMRNRFGLRKHLRGPMVLHFADLTWTWPASCFVPAELLTIRTFPSPNTPRHSFHASCCKLWVNLAMYRWRDKPRVVERAGLCRVSSTRARSNIRRGPHYEATCQTIVLVKDGTTVPSSPKR